MVIRSSVHSFVCSRVFFYSVIFFALSCLALSCLAQLPCIRTIDEGQQRNMGGIVLFLFSFLLSRPNFTHNIYLP
ncbi:MAG: hypothetical protein J3R72DRAFT_447418 [Linnemannia gamsii]|nr:MAG: hypothetical protein J3R72DRAFT_447418 [Linnemannia gamsii]